MAVVKRRPKRKLRCLLGRHQGKSWRFWLTGAHRTTIQLEWCDHCCKLIKASGGREY